MAKNLRKVLKAVERAQKAKAEARFYNLNSLLGNNWAVFYVICGSRSTGKSYSLQDFICRRKKKLGNMCKNFWMRISETSTKALLEDKAKGLIEGPLVKKWDLDLSTKGRTVYNRGEEFCTVIALSQMAKLKGVSFYDHTYKGEINIILDEFQLETGERRTSFDILYNFINSIETTIREQTHNVRIFLVGNTLEEASTILKAFNFLPEKFGRFYLRSKRCVIDNLQPTEEYLQEKSKSATGLLGGMSMSNYQNTLCRDNELIFKGQVKRPTQIIKFSKENDKTKWYTVWDNKVIRKYNNEQLPIERQIFMTPYIGGPYSSEWRKEIIERYDLRGWQFKNFITQSYFEADLKLIRKGY